MKGSRFARESKMRFNLLIAAGAAVMVTAALASAQSPSTTPDNRLICRGGGRELGSHIVTPRRCRTAERWKVEDDEKGAPANLRLTEGQNDGRVVPRPN
jgi:hypothetical protein